MKVTPLGILSKSPDISRRVASHRVAVHNKPFLCAISAKNNLFVHKNVIYDAGNDLNVPHIYFNGP